MDFRFSEEQEMIREMVRDFALREIEPVASEMDRDHEFPEDILEKMGAQGLLGIPVPEKYGGAGSDHLTYILALEEISRVWGSLGVIMAVHISDAIIPILDLGNEEQKQRFLPDLISGKMIGAFSITEPDAGSDAMSIKTKATRTDGGWLLNGTKTFVTSGSKAGVIIVMAITDPSLGSKGMTTFLVEKGMEGFSIGKEESKMGLHSSVVAELVFQDCFIPDKNILGKLGRGLHNALSILDVSRISIGAQAVGIAQAGLDEGTRYAKERKQFGRNIGRFQGVSFKLAEMATRVEASRMLVYRAADMVDRGEKSVSTQAAMAKLFASGAAVEVNREAVQILGGYGYTTDYLVERFYRDAKGTEIYEGTSEIMKLVIGKHLLK